MSSTTQAGGPPVHWDDDAYNSRVVRMFFAVLATVSIVAMSAAVIVSALSGRPAVSSMMSRTPSTAPAAVAAQPVVHVTIAGGSRMGPDGKMHDAFSVTNFAVQAGVPTRLVIDNTDTATHTITAPAIGVNIVARQGLHTYTLLVNKVGRFRWSCVAVCDTEAKGWAMSHAGYMSGYITASPAPSGA